MTIFIYSAVSHSGNDFGQLDGIQGSTDFGAKPSTPLRIANHDKDGDSPNFSTTVITSNFSSNDDSFKMTSIGNVKQSNYEISR